MAAASSHVRLPGFSANFSSPAHACSAQVPLHANPDRYRIRFEPGDVAAGSDLHVRLTDASGQSPTPRLPPCPSSASPGVRLISQRQFYPSAPLQP